MDVVILVHLDVIIHVSQLEYMMSVMSVVAMIALVQIAVEFPMVMVIHVMEIVVHVIII